MENNNLIELTEKECLEINGGGILVWAICLGIYNGYKQTEYANQ